MSAPRLNVGLIGAPSISHYLREAGHTVSFIEPQAASEYDLIVFGAEGEELEVAVEETAPFARHGQIYVHTALDYGIQVLDPIETTGAVVAAAHQLTDHVWATTAADELGETIIELLVGEMGGRAISVSDKQRLSLKTALTYAQLANSMHNDAQQMLVEVLDSPDVAEELIPAAPEEPFMPDVEELARQHSSISDPGRANLFASVVRRNAEVRDDHNLELWAISQLNYKE
ncbi:hypothetical protein [Corynebacterium lubricantis]|uniref:6PGD fold domain-containing protein n=1 Tax=Corynebacterium lubricantis TaxID=541095 RepID=UPI000477547D|nr:hypothetical protein [Corynebacterium lubricantis]